MTPYVTGDTIRALREKRSLTQKQLADTLSVSDKAISKWETGRGLPDITLLAPLAAALGVSLTELMAGECVSNQNRCGSLRRSKLYVCPVCGNIIHSLGAGAFSCCGITLPPLEAENLDSNPDEAHTIRVERLENGYDCFVSMAHPMTRDHYISCFLFVTDSEVRMQKLYPEQSAEARFATVGHGMVYALCNRHGVFCTKV